MTSMRRERRICAAAAAMAIGGLAAPGSAELVIVEVHGTVEYNQVNAPPVGSLVSGTGVVLSFALDSDVFMDSATYPTRGYVIDQASFSLTGNGTSIGLASPYPTGQTPYFVLRNNDPAVDGFFIADSVDFPIGVTLDTPGIFGDFEHDFSVGYVGSTLDSLDLLDAVGTYDFSGLTNFNWTINDGPFSPVGLVFESMTIVAVPAPAVLACFGLWSAAGAFGSRRRTSRNA